MMSKIALKVCSLAIVCTTVFSLTSCGNKSASTNELSQSKKIKIHLWEKPKSDESEGNIKVYEAWMAKVREKFPNIEIEDEALKPGTDYRQQYDRAMMAGEAPTATRIFSYTDIPTRIKNGTIADITDLFNDWDMKKQDKVITQFDEAISTKDGKWYAVPYQGYLMGTLYNSKAIKEGGGDPSSLPKTWAQFADLGQKLTDAKKPRFGYELLGMDWNAWAFTPWVWSAGGEMVKPNGDGTYKIAFNEDPGIDTAMFWNEMVWKYKMTQKDVLQDMNKIQEDIKAGRACFAWLNISSLKVDELAQYDLKISDFGFIPMPVKDESINNPTFTGGEVITFNPKATKEEIKAAWDVMTYFTYDEEMLTEEWKISNQYHSLDIKMPGRKDLYEKKLNTMESVPDRIKKDLLNGALNAKAEPFCSNWNDLKNAIAKPLQSILLKKDITRDEIKNILDSCADDLYKKYPNSFKK